MTRLRATGVGYEVPGRTLVAGVDFAATDGELIAIVGPNGAGKTTFVRMLAGDLSPSRGLIELDGSPLTAFTTAELALARGFLPQTIAADVPFEVADVVAMGRYPHRKRVENSAQDDVAAVEAALRETDTAILAERIFGTLSMGEQRRASLARVLAQRAPLLLLDEPTSAVDVHHQEGVMRVLVGESRRGSCVVAVLHDLNLAAAHADRIVLLDDGTVAASGTPTEVLDQEMLSRVYGEPMRVVDHPFRDCLLVLVAGS
jgi:iron complex transport system ATP-binding protein